MSGLTASGQRTRICETMRFGFRQLIPFFVSVLLFAGTGAVRSQVIVDRTVATVDDGIGSTELITYSDLLWTLAMQPGVAIAPPSSEELQRALELVVDQRLLAIEAKRLPGAPPTEAEVAAEIARIVGQFPTGAEFERRLRAVGFESVKDDNFERMMEERVKIEKYLDFRFRSFVVVTAEEESRYYANVFVPDFRRRFPGVIVPTFEASRERLNRELTEQRIAAQIEDFLDEARLRADIVVLSPL